MRSYLALFAVLAFAAPAAASPQPAINFKVQHYLVSGRDTTALERAVFATTPVAMNGQRYGAVTHNEFRTSYSAVGTGDGGCEIKNVRVILDSTIILPKLAPGQYSRAVLAEWSRYIGALTAHEMQHANNGKYTAETIAARLFNFRAPMPCLEMRPKLDRAIDSLIKNMGQWDANLDRDTNHGATQGAFLRKGIR